MKWGLLILFWLTSSLLIPAQKYMSVDKAYLDDDNKIDSIYKYPNHKYMIYSSKTKKYIKVDITKLTDYLNRDDDSDNEVTCSGSLYSEKKEEIIIFSGRREGNDNNEKFCYKYFSNLNNWLLYSKLSSSYYLDYLVDYSLEFYPYSESIDGISFTPNKELFLKDSLVRAQNSEKIFDEVLHCTTSSLNLKNYSLNDMCILLYNIPIDSGNVEKYNNFAYYISKTKGNEYSATYLYKCIIEKFPQRTVTYLNYADTYWSLNTIAIAKENYQKYIDLMKAQQKDLNRIPKRVYERLEMKTE
jgi:hypothetical protein